MSLLCIILARSAGFRPFYCENAKEKSFIPQVESKKYGRCAGIWKQGIEENECEFIAICV